MELERSEKIIDVLRTRGATQPCPRCGNKQFDVVAETFLPVTSPDAKPGMTDGMPAVVIACRNCGFVTLHALRPLGIEEELAHAG